MAPSRARTRATLKTTQLKPFVVPERTGESLGHYEGLALMALGIVLIVVAGCRFVRTARRIDAPEPQNSNGVRIELIVTTVLVLLVAAYCLSILIG